MNMTSEQLFEAIEEDCAKRKCYDDYLVRVRYKYKWEIRWRYSNEYLEFNGINWCWLNDWNEGQEYVEFLGFIAVDDIDVPAREDDHSHPFADDVMQGGDE